MTEAFITDLFSLAPCKPTAKRWKGWANKPGSRTRERDMQRKRVYKADEATKPFDSADVSSVPLMQAYVKRVWSSKRMLDAFPQMVFGGLPKVKDGRGRRRAAGNASAIWMPTWSRREGIVLHELAHTITHRCYDSNVAGHGWQYCHVYLHLVLYMMGREAHDALKLAFKANRVRFTMPRTKRVLTEKQRTELVARLESARSRKHDDNVAGSPPHHVAGDTAA